MSDVQRYAGRPAARGLTRQTTRTLTRIEERADTEAALVEARAEIQSFKADALSAVTQRALQGAAFVSQVEQQLGQTVPLAVSRLQAIGDIGALGLSEIVMETANKLRRI